MRVWVGILAALFSWLPDLGAMERFDIVTTESLEALLKSRDAGQADFLLVNTLDELIFCDSAIPGSINVPWSRVDDTIERLGSDPSRLLIFY